MFIGNAPVGRKGLLLGVILFTFGILSFVVSSATPHAGFAGSRFPPIPLGDQPPTFEARFVSQGKTQIVHSVAAVELSEGKLRAFWYGGSDEHAKDVAVYTSLFEPEKGVWSPEVVLMTSENTRRSLHRYIKKLGNVVVLKDDKGQLWLFYVSVSVGRWSGSAINLTMSENDGETWSPPRRLITSPFFNMGTLVKGPPLLLDDGTIGLPAYHEFIGRFGELLRLDRAGSVVHKTRLSWGSSSLQPIIIPRTHTNAIGLMRYSGPAPRRILSLQTIDGGFQWSSPTMTDLPNPNSAIAGIRLENDDLLLVFNDSEYARDNLSLAYREREKEAWRIVYQFEKKSTHPDGRTHEFSYPWIIRTQNGDFHVLYTWHRTHIKQIQFNQSWLDQILQSPSRL